MGVVGAALRGFGKALRAHRIKHGKRGKTITGVKPLSGKIFRIKVRVDKDAGRRKEIVRTHFSLKRSEKIDKAEKKVKEGKAELKKMVDTGQAEEYSNMPGVHKKKGFK